MLGLAITALQAAVVLLLIWRSDGWTAHPLGRTVAAPEAASARPADDDGPLAISVMRLAVPDRSTSSPNLTTHVVSCPLYSGPGYDAKRHASREVTLPAFEAPFASTPRPPTLSVEAVPLSDVRLTPGSAFHAAFETNLQYLKLLSADSLLLAWRLTAHGGKWKPGSLRLMGWEHTGSELRGHFLGHWLSASAMAFAATRDAELGHRMAEVRVRLRVRVRARLRASQT